MQNADINNQDREVRELLRDYPAPAPDEGFYERALVRATHEGSKRQRNRWMLAGFGSAVAAGLGDHEILLLVIDWRKTQAGLAGDRFDGHAPIGPATGHRRRHGEQKRQVEPAPAAGEHLVELAARHRPAIVPADGGLSMYGKACLLKI